MQILREILGKVLRLFLPKRWMRILRDPVLLPGYYRKFAQDVEPLIDMAQNGRNKDPEYLMAMLRKYAHIIDKALERPDYEPGHSRQWYDAAKTTLNLLEKNYASDPTITWVKEKIQEYEKRQRHPKHTEKYGHIYSAEEDYHTLMRIIKERRSIRNFTDQPVEIEKINRIMEAINWAPSSCNRQPAKVFITTKPALVEQCASTCAGATCFSGGACFISFCADMRVYNLPEEYHLPDIDIGLGIQNSLLIAHALGLSITLLSWAQHTDADDINLRAILGIPKHYKIIVNALLGYPASSSAAPVRKKIDDTLVLVEHAKNKDV